MVGIAGLALADPVLALRAQVTGNHPPRIAYLSAIGRASHDPAYLEAFRQGLAENGLVDGRDLTLDYQWADGSADRLRELGAELARSDATIIVTGGAQAIGALIAAGVRQPIVMVAASDAVGAGFAKSLARPGGNVTGLSVSNTELEAKRLQILKEIVPSLGRVFVLSDPTNSDEGLPAVRAAAQTLGVTPVVVSTRDPSAFAAAFASTVASGVDGLAVMASVIFYFHRRRLVELAARHELPAIWQHSAYVRDGGLVSYGPDYADMYRRSAGYVARVLRGADPADLPLEQPTVFELLVNLGTARALGLALPASLLRAADVVIE